jgi:hypothetical protein
MRAAAAAAPEWERALAAAGVPASPSPAAASPTAAAAAAGVPANLRTGVAPRAASASPRGAAAAAAAAAVKPSFPVQLASWKGTFRAALLGAVAGDAPAAGPQLAEVLHYDRERLHACQNAFQQLMVLAAGMLIVQQFRQQQGLGWSGEQRAAARRRLLVVLSDPGMRLGDLVTEIARLAGEGAAVPEQGQAGGQGLALEPQVKQVFMSIVDPGSGPYRSIRQALSAAALAHLLHGGAAVAADEGLARGVAATLAKVRGSARIAVAWLPGSVRASRLHFPGAGGPLAGRAASLPVPRHGLPTPAGCLPPPHLPQVGASALVADVAALGEQLAGIAAVNEVVHDAVLINMSL